MFANGPELPAMLTTAVEHTKLINTDRIKSNIGCLGVSSYIRSQKRLHFRAGVQRETIAARVRTARWLAPGSRAAFQTYLTMIEVCYIRHFDTMTKCQVFSQSCCSALGETASHAVRLQ